MIFHASIEADEPCRVAHYFAELWDGIATPFPAVIEGGWVALSGDERNTLLEVYPRGTELYEDDKEGDAFGMLTGSGRRSATHLAVATDLATETVMAMAGREGWPARYRKRGGIFGAIELWVEGVQMIEVLTPEMEAEYRRGMTIEGWNRVLEKAEAMA